MTSTTEIAKAIAVIFIVLPARCMVAQSGMQKSAISSFTPFFFACASVTGIVAADDEVPKAVIYAGSILPSSFIGFCFDTAPATPY